ncbi:MAG: 4-hydroxy-tetrahydrodipicolinate reductase [Phycisphaerales bacterium]
MRESLSSRAGATRVVIHGAAGRVGARLCDLAHRDDTIALVGAIVRAGSPRLGHASAPASHKGESVVLSGPDAPRVACDVVIDFSGDEGAPRALALAQAGGAALLVGTTALSAKSIDALRAASNRQAVLVAANTALGVAVLATLVRAAAEALGTGFTASIVEAHHAAKKDAPSGTAKRLAAAIRDAGNTGSPLRDDQVVAIRGGDVVGEHTVRFAGPGEYVEFTHRATTRDVFALGALRAARWLHGRGPGWWTTEDVLGLATPRTR